MSKLIGTDPNQVPSNADLGSAAFMDKKEFLLSKGSNISAIDAIIPKTAVDVFIYDTSKDSDGGAWRKRTQHTSWYNEKLNTTIRGSRREFPSVAVIVATTAGIYIYDGDDPSLPFWRLFEAGYNSYGGVVLWDAQHLSLSALNGIICVGNRHGNVLYAGNGLYQYKLISDIYQNDTKSYSGKHSSGVYSPLIYGSNDTNTIRTHNLVNYSVSDVSMTVLPDAKTDPVTGLPVPTIAVGTYGGIAIIESDGTTINSSSNTTYPIHEVNILSTGELYHRQGFSNGSNEGVNYNNPYSRISGVDLGTYANSTTFWYATDGTGNLSSILGSSTVPPNCVVATEKSTFHVGDTKGLSNISVNSSSVNEGMVNWVTTDYVTGWMPGDIKIATLADTDANDNGKEFITNGDFSNGTTGWSVTTGASITESGGVATVTSSGSNIWSGAYQGISGLEIGKTYIATADIITSSNWGSFSFSNGAGSAVKYGSYSSWNGGSSFPLKARAYFVATATSVVLSIDSLNTTAATVTQIDNITVREAVVDRSVNAVPLQVYGTMKKTPVAAGSDLIAYSGFSTSNYIRQPYNTRFNFGSGSFSVMAWVKTAASSGAIGYVAQIGPSDNDEVLSFYMSDNYGVYFDYGSGTQYVYLSNSVDRNEVLNQKWHHVTLHVTAGEAGHIYIDGVKRSTGNNGTAPSTFTFDTDYFLNIGQGRGTDTLVPFNGSLALLRISATVPSAGQIKKIYNDEKMLFQENAKATLYGTSDAVTALAYDDSTNLLHAGTSSGRSVFQGLQRIDNTTNAIGTAISAVDGMVVEE